MLINKYELKNITNKLLFILDAFRKEDFLGKEKFFESGLVKSEFVVHEIAHQEIEKIGLVRSSILESHIGKQSIFSIHDLNKSDSNEIECISASIHILENARLIRSISSYLDYIVETTPFGSNKILKLNFYSLKNKILQDYSGTKSYKFASKISKKLKDYNKLNKFQLMKICEINEIKLGF